MRHSCWQAGTSQRLFVPAPETKFANGVRYLHSWASVGQGAAFLRPVLVGSDRGGLLRSGAPGGAWPSCAEK